MINTRDMIAVRRDYRPHESHRMGPEESTIASCASNERFATMRTCRGCGANEVRAAGVHYLDAELQRACTVPIASRTRPERTS